MAPNFPPHSESTLKAIKLTNSDSHKIVQLVIENSFDGPVYHNLNRMEVVGLVSFLNNVLKETR